MDVVADIALHASNSIKQFHLVYSKSHGFLKKPFINSSYNRNVEERVYCPPFFILLRLLSELVDAYYLILY